jgi:phosphomethylpyrimidine synthase
MADINSPLEIGVTTGPIRGSRKIYVESPNFPG